MALSCESTITFNVWDREVFYRELLSCSRLVKGPNGWIWDLNFFRFYNVFVGQVSYKEGISTDQLFDAKKGVSERLILKILN